MADATLQGFGDPSEFSDSVSPPGFGDPAGFAAPPARKPLRTFAAHRSTNPYDPENVRERDKPLEQAVNPLEMLIPMRAAGVAMEAVPSTLPWLAQALLRGGAAGATFGAVEDAASGRNPASNAAGNFVAGAALGPPVEALGGAVVRGVRGLRGNVAPKPAAAPAPAESTPGALRPFSGKIEHPAPTVEAAPAPARKTPVVTRDHALNMDADQLRAAAHAERAWERQGAVDVFGPERAKVYETNYARADRFDLPEAERRAAAKIVQDMEASLTDAQRNRLFGVGEGGFNAEDLRMLANAAGEYHPEALASMDDAELGNHLARAMTEKGVSGADATATRQAIVLRNTLMEANRRGWGEQQVMEAVTSRARALRMDPNEIAGLARARIAELSNPAAPAMGSGATATPQLPAGAPKLATAGPVETPAPGADKATNAQQFPALGEFRAQVEADPAFQARIRELGGGKVVTNNETLAAALNEGPMDPAELGAWKADAPVNPVIQTRGLLTFDHFQQKRLTQIRSGDIAGAAETNRIISDLLPGVQNLRATGGRTTQAQAMFVQDEMSKALNELADMQAKGIPFDQVQARANALVRAAQAAARRKGFGEAARSWIENLQTAATFAKLTSPMTHAVNTISNAATFAVRAIEKPATAAALAAQGQGNAARAEVSYLFGTTLGMRGGLRRYVSAILDEAPDMGGVASEAARKPIPLPKPLRPFDVFRQLSGADAFWKSVLHDAKLHELAHASALDEGLTGPALAKRVQALVADPPANWKAEADAVAAEFTFQGEPDTFLKAVQKIQGLPGVRFFIPFVQTPYNLAKFQFQRSAAGVLSPRNIGGLAEGGRAQAEAAGRLTTGLALSSGALALVNSTDVTGDYPKDPHARALWDASGIKPYSIRIGNRYVNYNRFAPIGMYIGQAVALRDAIATKNQDGIGTAASRLFATALKQVNDMPFLSGVSDMLDALSDPEKKAEKFLRGVATGFVPNALRDVRNQTDPVVRRTESIGQAVQNMIPGQSQKLQSRVDVLGRVTKLEPGRAERATKFVSTRIETPETKLLAQIGWSPSMPDPTIEVKGLPRVKLAGADLTKFQTEMGEATRAAIRPFTSNERFLRMERDEQIDLLNRAIEDARRPVRARWRTAQSEAAAQKKGGLGTFGTAMAGAGRRAG